MISYYGYTISPNQIETGEGFLICRNVPIARIGEQVYLGRELGLEGADADRPVTVCRPPDEVFSPAALASFEGKPVTNDHPPGLIGPDDVRLYEMGHAGNIRRGTDEWTDYVLADLHIHDRTLIDAVQAGKREISCGYECDYVLNGDGTYSQKNIRGNHVAVVARARAGKRAAILDSKIKNPAEKPPERKVTVKNVLLTLFGLAAKDRTPEEITKLAMDTASAFEEEKAPESGKEAPKEEEKEQKDAAEKTKAAEDAMLDSLAEKLAKRLAASGAKGSENGEKSRDALDEAIRSLTEKDEEKTESGKDKEGEGTEEAKVVPAEAADEDIPVVDRALAAGILKTMRPSIAAIRDEKQRKEVSDALIACVTAKDGESDIAKILKAVQQNARKAADSRPEGNLDEIQAAYDRMNPHSPHYGKERK